MQVSPIVEPHANGKLHRDTLLLLVGFHLLAAAALFYFSWQNLAAFFVVWWIAGSLGIGLGYHRLLTHRGFKAPRWLERALVTCGTLALQSGPIGWVTTHRVHHAFAEQESDPHSPRHGKYWSHVGWVFRGTAYVQPWDAVRKYSPDVVRDPYYRFISKYYYLPPAIVGLVLLAIGGFSMVLWGIAFQTVLGWHLTWAVNSVTHIWGKRRFATRDDSQNNALVAAFTFGEGWHNNHHAHPRSARHGLTWREVDLNWLQIRLFEKLGLITDVYAYDLNAEPVIDSPRAAFNSSVAP